MATQERSPCSKEGSATPPARVRRRFKPNWPLWLRVGQIGCLPLVVIVTGLCLLLINLIAFRNAPYWIPDPLPYLLSRRLGLSLGILGITQLALSWILGSIASVAATLSFGEQKASLQIARRRVSVAAWAVVLVRLALLLGLAIATLYTLTDIFGIRLRLDIVGEFIAAFRAAPWLILVAIWLLLLQGLVGPFLHLRYSLALGMLAATWSKQPDERTWLALSARLGADLSGVIASLWGAGLALLLWLMLVDPRHGSPTTSFTFFPSLYTEASQILVAALLIALLVPLHAAGQIILPPLYIKLARLRMAKRRESTNYLKDTVGT